MIRLTALNDDSSRSSVEDDVYPKEPPQEVQEENALKLYNEALQEQSKGNTDKAESLYKQLLATNYITKVKPDEESAKVKKSESVFMLYSKPGLMLKYSCLKNLAALFQKKNLLSEALNYYTQALEVEGSDVSMWFQSGCIALKLSNLRRALESFLKGLEFSPKHWPSLDKLIICLFSLYDYVNCLYFISKAFEIDVCYTRGHVLRDHIFKEQPSLKSDIKFFFPKIDLHLDKKTDVSQDIQDKLLEEVLNICREYSSKCRSEVSTVEKDIKSFTPCKEIESGTWVSLGEHIMDAYQEFTDQEENLSFLTPINLRHSLVESKIQPESSTEAVAKTSESEDVANGATAEDDSGKKPADSNCDKKNKKNKGSALMEELLWGGKRRSARVRSSLRGNPEPMDVAEALRRILPRKLLHKSKQSKTLKPSALEEDSMDTMDLYRLFERQESLEEKKQKEEQEKSEAEQDVDMIVESEGYFGKKAEEDDVKSFINRENGQNIIEIVRAYVMALKIHWSKTWPNALPAVYIKCFQLMRRHYPIDFKMCTTESKFRDLVQESGCILLYGELCLEHSASAKNKNTNESRSSTPLQIIFLQNIMELTDRVDMFESEESYFEFLLRLYWLRCRIFLDTGQTNLAIVSLNDVLACYELFPQYESKVLHLRNCRKHNIISKVVTEEFLAHQSRKRSLAEVVRLYEDESYEELTEILKETFTTTQHTVSQYFKDEENELVDRQTQLSMLINGLYHLNEYKECIYWLETCCYEVLQKACSQAQSFDEDGESWMVAFDRFLVAFENCLSLGDLNVIDVLPQNRISRFVQTLCHAICKELEDSDRPPCPARPWIMLNTILVGLEAKERGKIPQEEEECEDDDEHDIPSSILILFTAHEYLGRREWCNCNDSILLFSIMDQVIPHIRNPEWASFRETVQQHLEQVIYCLYSHPNKKSKARYLTDHNVNSIPLTWQRGIQLFDLFRPDETPSYDSLRINLIGSETEVLFRRIAALIPDDKDPAQMSDKMTEFIVGKRNDVPDTTVHLPEPVQNLFYILGDYYFKTHEFAKAVNYLLMDLCANPDRVDSWASMALSRASLLEQQLNSCDPLKDEVFLQSALSALRCYEHCLQLDNKQCALWIEYGSFVYTIHSFCSQRMKLESFNLSIEQFEELESTKNKMLETAKQAFLNANLIWYEINEDSDRQDERWLHHYMLGKICEKNGDLSFFDHYEKAADLLYENEAEFPNKVGYTAPQTLAIEALEVYYRVHVCIIKNLELNEGKALDPKTRQLFNKHLNICSKGPFARQVSKGDLAKLKAKELESIQQEKQLKAVKAVLNDIITKIEEESEKSEKEAKSPVKEVLEVSSPSEPEVKPKAEVEGGEDDISKNTGDSVNSKPVEKPSDPETGVVKSEKCDAGDNLPCPVESTEKNEPESTRVESEPLPAELLCETKIEETTYNCSPNGEDDKTIQQVQPKAKKRRRTSHASVSSSSCGSTEMRFDDDSSSESSSSESSASSQSSSSSSSESSHSQSDDTNKDGSNEEDNQSDVGSGKSHGKNSESDDRGDKSKSGSSSSEYNMLMKCLKAFETCALRFPQHYKSVYRLAHFYFRSKEHRDLSKCKDLLLGRYQTPNGTIPGLFAERKNSNFFNGIWRIPAGDVDRPGSFASHMSRSVLLLMEVLRDLKDHKMLLEICLQLRKTPEPDKKYLREDERNQLSVQACDLAIQTLRKNVKDSSVMTLPLVLDCYRLYQKVQKHYTHKESVYGDILLEAFKRLGKGDKCTLDQALRFCQSEVSTVKPKVPKCLSPGQTLSVPKPPKAKKQEKKKSTPKPQVTAKVVQKNPRPKKPSEQKKKPALNVLPQNVLMDPTFWSSVMKNSGDSSKASDLPRSNLTAGAQMYAELLRAAALSAKHREQKVTDQQTVKSVLDHFKADLCQKMAADAGKLNSGFYQYPNYPLDYASEQYAKLMSNFWGGSLPGTSFGGHVPNLTPPKSKPKVAKPHHQQQQQQQQSVLKSNVQKLDLVKLDEPKAKTNFNIEDILAKPALTITKTPAQPGSTPAPPRPPSPSPSSLIKSIEEKIKSISKEVHITKCPPQVINLSVSRKGGGSDATGGKRPLPEPYPETSTIIKKICRNPDSTGSGSGKKDEIEIVVIDD